MGELKKVKFLRPIQSKNIEIEQTDGLQNDAELADEFIGEVCGFCECDGKIIAIIADESSHQFYQSPIDELTII